MLLARGHPWRGRRNGENESSETTKTAWVVPRVGGLVGFLAPFLLRMRIPRGERCGKCERKRHREGPMGALWFGGNCRALSFRWCFFLFPNTNAGAPSENGAVVRETLRLCGVRQVNPKRDLRSHRPSLPHPKGDSSKRGGDWCCRARMNGVGAYGHHIGRKRAPRMWVSGPVRFSLAELAGPVVSKLRRVV